MTVDTRTLVVVDTETTGLDTQRDRVVQLYYAVVRGGDVLREAEHLFNPGIAIPTETTAIHGITDDMVRDHLPFSARWQDIKLDLEQADAWVGYNAPFDIAMLQSEFNRCGALLTPPGVVLDPKRLWDIHEPRPRRDLQEAYRRFVDTRGFDGAHDACEDAMATLQVLLGQLDAWGMRDQPIELIDPERRTWWGPSNHVQWWQPPAYDMREDVRKLKLMCGWGKHKGALVGDVSTGYWRWVLTQNFPPHVKRLAERLVDKVWMSQNMLVDWARKEYP